MGAIGQKNTPSEDSSCLVGSAALPLALVSPELDAECSGRLAERRIVGDRSALNCIVGLTATRRNTVGQTIFRYDLFWPACPASEGIRRSRHER